MRLLRIAALSAFILAVLIGGTAALIAVNQERIVAYVLASVRNRTGVDIIPRSSSVHLSTHLVVVLDQPQVIDNGHEIVKLKSLSAIVSYHSIFVSTGLPLYRLIAAQPDITLPITQTNTAAISVPRPGTPMIDAMQDSLHALSRICWRVEAVDATVRYADGTEVANHVGIVAYHTRSDPYRWLLGFSGALVGTPVSGARVSGKFSLGIGKNQPPGEFAHGAVWTWDVPLEGIEVEGFSLVGTVQNTVKFLLHDDGTVTGDTDAEAPKLTLVSKRLVAPENLGAYSLHAAFEITDGKYAFRNIVLRHVDTPILVGETELVAPESNNPKIGIHLGGFRLEASVVKQLLAVRRLPADLVDALKRLGPGKVTVGDATLSAALNEIKTAPLDTIRKNLVVSGTVQDLGFVIPAETKLPPVSNLSAQISYSKGLLTISQGTAKFGNSVVHDLVASANLVKGIEGADYKTSVSLNADLDELYPAIARFLEIYQLRERDRLEHLSGRVEMVTTASGKLSVKTLSPPTDYQVRADVIGTVLAIKGSPGPLKVSRGTVAIDPTSIKFENVMLAATGGNATLDGTVNFAKQGVTVRDLTLGLHDFPSALWLTLLVDPSDFSVTGPIGGKLVVNGNPSTPGGLTPEGKLTLAKGDVKFNFLRAPIITQGATLTMHRKQVVLAMPGSRLEDSPINFRVTVADYTHPSIRIDATVQKLDLEVLTFVRMPWSPATPPIHFPVPCLGHIEARAANLAAFQMTDTKTDFTRDAVGNWRVYNLTATAYRGKMRLELDGRAPDNWIRIVGSATDMDPAPLFMLGGKNKQSPLLGHLFLATDLWANTDTNFFETLAGDMTITVRDGTLNKFTLLSRLLSFIDIKNWLSAQIPDPRIAGVPFKTIFTDFKGNGGLFYTDNFALKGPVMDITASGSVQFGAGTLDMDVGVFPFDTVDWVLNHIPVIGDRLGAGTGKLVAAYFHVKGPVSDPSIVPKPITSVANFVKKTLGMPINIIRPNTIK
ncbi:AsmA-like C-terminal domain-containing protein [Candidatus Binatus sp.]|uniref:AsmA-like C-terminal domain-containing protein n=1 Tax=Candidatus Binatus sp. TaxID=2811406 RepID=UPI003C8FB7C2